MILVSFAEQHRVILVFVVFCICSVYCRIKPHYLYHGEVLTYDPSDYNENSNNLKIYCYRGKPKYVIHLWQSVLLIIDHKTNNYIQYDGRTSEEVERKYEEHQSSWTFNLFAWKQSHFKLNPFNQSCIGIISEEPYTIHLNVIRVDYWKVLLLVSGLILFFSAKRLCTNSIFYYICGILFGICTSFLILIYVISKLLPGKRLMYGVAVCGWTVGVYILQMLWENIRIILLSYQTYVTWYIVLSGIASFLVCYRLGPVTNERTRTLIRWSLQSAGLLAIFFSSHFQEAAMGQIVIVLLLYNIPKSWLAKSRTYWKKKFPPKVRLLTNEEYYQQGVQETCKALEDLRKYCSSPNCNQWKTVLKLKDVKRFASFMEGSSHLSDSEILEYESSLQQLDVTDDDLSEEEY